MGRLLDPDDALLAVIDVQTRHFPHVLDGEVALDRITRMASAARALEVPVLWTEHYARAFGPTVPSLAQALEGLEPIHKVCFGCFGEPAFAAAVEASGRGTLVLVGTETHICIAQTGLAALDRGMAVVAVADALTARARVDHDVALRRLERAGAVVSTWEAVVYEWMRTSRHEKFSAILPLVKG